MRFVIQRVSHAQVTLDGQVRGSILNGYMVLIGIGQEDTEALADRMIAKMLDLRIFEAAMTFKIATMVMNYMHTERNQ